MKIVLDKRRLLLIIASMPKQPLPKLKKGLALCSKAERTRIAKLGGAALSQDSSHMAEIGRRGGKSRGKS